MSIHICVAGVTGWTGSLVAKAILKSDEFKLVGAIARKASGRDVGEALDAGVAGVKIVKDIKEVQAPIDVLVDYTKPDSVKSRVLEALNSGMRAVIGTSGLSAADFEDIEKVAKAKSLGVIAAGNFSITAALAKRFALIAAEHLPSWEIVDYAHADKIDAPSGTTRELAEKLAEIKACKIEHPIEMTTGHKDARGAAIAGTQVHSIRLPSYVIAFETIFGLPNERLTIRHDAGSGADPYVNGTLLAVRRVMKTTGLVRGLDSLLFE